MDCRQRLRHPIEQARLLLVISLSVYGRALGARRAGPMHCAFTRNNLGRNLLSLMLRGVLRLADIHGSVGARGHCGRMGSLLRDVNQFVSKKSLSLDSLRRELSFTEDDVFADSVCLGVQGLSRF